MRFSTFYFTGTGNTWWAAREFTSIAKNAGHEAAYYSLESETLQKGGDEMIARIIKESDAIGIAYPVYGSTLPEIMWDFLDRLIRIRRQFPQIERKVGYTLTTMALFSGDGALVPRKKLKQAHFILKGAINLIMASNMGIPYFRYNPVGMEKLERRKAYDRKKLAKLVRRLGSGKKYLEGRNPFLIAIGFFQRIFMPLEKKIIHKYWSVHMESCTRCMLCVNTCPTDSIEYFEEKDTFTLKSTCISCLRCYNYCPTNSILLFNKGMNTKKYRRHRGPGEGFKLSIVKE